MLKSQENTEPLEKLLEELQACGIKVSLCPGQVSPRTGNGAHWATADIDHRGARVFFPEHAATHAIFHEVAHLHRAFVERQPILVATPDFEAHSGNIQEINNDLDHIAIIRDEVAYYPEAVAYWTSDFQRVLNENRCTQAQTEVESLNSCYALMRAWMVACTSLQDIGVVGAMRSELVRFGAAKAADDLARTIERCGGDKMGCLRALQVAQTYPQARHFNLLAYDPARKRFQPV